MKYLQYKVTLMYMALLSPRIHRKSLQFTVREPEEIFGNQNTIWRNVDEICIKPKYKYCIIICTPISPHPPGVTTHFGFLFYSPLAGFSLLAYEVS